MSPSSAITAASAECSHTSATVRGSVGIAYIDLASAMPMSARLALASFPQMSEGLAARVAATPAAVLSS